LLYFVAVSDSDLDTCGSALKWLPWIRNRIGNTDPGSETVSQSGQSKREKIKDSKLKRTWTILLKGLMLSWINKELKKVFIF